MVHILLKKEEFDKFLSDHEFVVVDFFAEWCGPCKMIAPQFEEWSKEHPMIKFCKVDVDQAEEITKSSGVRAMPTFHFFKGGKKIAEVVGANVDKIKSEIEKIQSEIDKIK